MLLFLPISIYPKEYVIFSIEHELPMNNDFKSVNKNFYLNLGKNEGARSGSVLNVFRRVSIKNPYDDQNRVNYKIKIGEIEVLHTNPNASIGILSKFSGEKSPIFEINHFMIGDTVELKTSED